MKSMLSDTEDRDCGTRRITTEIGHSDLVLALYKARAGSRMSREPWFYGTDFELFHARRLGIPVHLYVMGREHSRELDGVLKVYGEQLVLPDGVTWCDTEDDLLNCLQADTLLYAACPAIRPNSEIDDEHCADLDRESLERVHDAVTAKLAQQDYWGAAGLVSQVPVCITNVPPELKVAYAGVLSLSAHTWGNQRNYRFAEKCSRLAIRFFMERGSFFRMLQEIQNLSGILNMANHVGDAYAVNTYGLAATARHFGFSGAGRHDFKMLLNGFYDSRASILTKLGRWPKARDILAKAIPPDGDASPYTFAKYAVALNSVGAIDTAYRLVDEVVLCLAQQRQESVGYVARDAARIALSAGESKRAFSLLSQAEKACVDRGQLHTLMQVRRLMREVQRTEQIS
jgi:hypothetical protein